MKLLFSKEHLSTALKIVGGFVFGSAVTNARYKAKHGSRFMLNVEAASCELIFSSKKKAEECLREMRRDIQVVGYSSAADACTYAKVKIPKDVHDLADIRWTDLKKAKIRPHKDVWILYLPMWRNEEEAE